MSILNVKTSVTARERLKALRKKEGVNKIMSVEQAISLIEDGDNVATGGFVCANIPEYFHAKIEEKFLATGKPRDLGLMWVAGQGDGGDRNLNRYGHEGLLRMTIGAHYALAPKLQKLVLENKIAGYNIQQGALSHMLRSGAGLKPGVLTETPLGTFSDPRKTGGKISAKCTEDIISLMEVGGKEYAFIKTVPVHVAILRGTTADEDGNISIEKEAVSTELLTLALNAHANKGIVMVQVERIAQRNTLPAQSVRIPGVLVDCVVMAPAEYHWQTFDTFYTPAYSGEIKVPMTAVKPIPLDERKIIARRGAMEIDADTVLNLGIGVPEGVASVAAEEGISSMFTLTTESGTIGGVPCGKKSFGTTFNPTAILDQAYQFDFYDGGGLDTCFLGLAQADQYGNLNVGQFGPKLAGVGGFTNISNSSKTVCFVGTLTAGGLEVAIKDGKLVIIKEGKIKKFMKDVESISFNGQLAAKRKQRVFYMTERCVFKLGEDGKLHLIEVAPGIDIETQILAQMEFKPVINGTPKIMDARIFKDQVMGLKEDILARA